LFELFLISSIYSAFDYSAMNSDYFASPFGEYLFCRRLAFTCVFFYEKHISYQVAATGCLDRGKEESSLDFAESSLHLLVEILSTF